MFEVRDKSKLIKFDGELLAESSSRHDGQPRWIEFALYRTDEGTYILSRVGMSLLFHDPSCVVVTRNGLKRGEPLPDSVPCDICTPALDAPYLYVEQSRYWAQVSTSPAAVLDALYQYDEAGARYLTRVAARLLENASQVDSAVLSAYQVEYVR